jgi:peptidoglycan/xylan/chitin deacetylase (PgdA/CDA1 family)
MVFRFKFYSVIALLFISNNLAAESQSGVILMYHHVSNDTPAVTSISPKMFEQHMAYINKHHQVIPLEVLVEKLRKNQSLPDKAVAITFDDGYDNIYANAHPILVKYQFPYTIFINPPLIGRLKSQLDWQQVKKMAKQGASFANHSSKHNHLLQRLPNENEQDWLKRTLNDIEDAQRELMAKLGTKHRYLAYPYGEYNLALQEAIKAKGYTGFGQHSGAVGHYSDYSALPRFPAAGIYANLNTLETKLNSLALPVTAVSFSDPDLTMQTLKPSQTLTLKVEGFSIDKVNCFFKGEPLPIKRTSDTITFAVAENLQPGRARINCTAPSDQDSSRFYWHSQPYFVATEDGTWLD